MGFSTIHHNASLLSGEAVCKTRTGKHAKCLLLLTTMVPLLVLSDAPFSISLFTAVIIGDVLRRIYELALYVELVSPHIYTCGQDEHDLYNLLYRN